MENTLQLGNLLKEGTYPEEYTGGEKLGQFYMEMDAETGESISAGESF